MVSKRFLDGSEEIDGSYSNFLCQGNSEVRNKYQILLIVELNEI